MTPLRRRSSMLVATALVVGGLTACASDSDSSHDGSHGSAHATTSPTTTSSPGSTSTTGSTGTTSAAGSADASREGDISFAQMMIPHHEQAVEMSDLALAKPGASAQVRDLATQIKKAQDPEIATMRGWLASWGAPTAAPTGMAHDHGDGMMSAREMAQLEAATGADFDRRWLTMMIAHHEGAVTMSEQVLGTTKDPAVRTLAESIISGQKAEISTMRGLL